MCTAGSLFSAEALYALHACDAEGLLYRQTDVPNIPSCRMGSVLFVFQHAAYFALIQDCAYKEVVAYLSSDSVRKLSLGLQLLKLHVRDLKSAEFLPAAAEDTVIAETISESFCSSVGSDCLVCLYTYTLAHVE